MVVPPLSKFSSENSALPPRKVSTPRTILSHPDDSDGLRVPRSALRILRDRLGAVYPELAEKPWAETRLCWWVSCIPPFIILFVFPSSAFVRGGQGLVPYHGSLSSGVWLHGSENTRVSTGSWTV